MSTPSGALDGIRVIEVGTLISGPFAGRLLGDMGADVIKSSRRDPPTRSAIGAGRTRRAPLPLDGARRNRKPSLSTCASRRAASCS